MLRREEWGKLRKRFGYADIANRGDSYDKQAQPKYVVQEKRKKTRGMEVIEKKLTESQQILKLIGSYDNTAMLTKTLQNIQDYNDIIQFNPVEDKSIIIKNTDKAVQFTGNDPYFTAHHLEINHMNLIPLLREVSPKQFKKKFRRKWNQGIANTSPK